MATESAQNGEIGFSGPPDRWTIEQFEAYWTAFVAALAKEVGPSIPEKRIRYQIEQTPAYRDITARWEKMNGPQRVDAWKALLAATEKATGELLPACVRCGECCRRGSPALHAEDLDLLREGKIGWNRIITLRTGEPARSQVGGTLFMLPEERIKIRERQGTGACLFFDADLELCTIYEHRPLECRAQACWDSAAAKEAAELPHLSRKDIFAGADLLLGMIAEHDSRCAFAVLKEAFEHLDGASQETVDAVLKVLSYEDHFRNFVKEQFEIPDDTLELVFGRSFADLAPVFGFRIVAEPDGTRRLVPDEPGEEKDKRAGA